MSELSAFQSDATFVILILAGVEVSRGLTPIASYTLVIAVSGLALPYQLMYRFPSSSVLRIAGRNCQPVPAVAALSTITGSDWTGKSVRTEKLCKSISPDGLNLASFHTMLTVPYLSLTAIRGKSFIGKRL